MSRPAVMVVDDDSALLTAMTGLMQLHMPGVRVEPFASPRMALARFEKKEVAAMVTDLKMNELDGLALLRGAKALRPSVPVILVSGHVDSALASQAMKMGAQDVLQKPFNRQQFLTVLTVALETYQLAREVRGRLLLTERLGKRLEGLKQLIADSHQRPNTIKRIQGIVSTSRELNGKSLSSLESSLDRLWHYAKLAEARLDVAQQRLIVRQQESHDGVLKRIACLHV
jgi:FixJ family two-component response regulator